MQSSELCFTGAAKHSSRAVLQPSDIFLHVDDGDTPCETASHVLSRQGSDSIDVSWIRPRDQRWFCGWIWGVDAASLPSPSHNFGSSVDAGVAARKPVSVNDLAGDNAFMYCNTHSQYIHASLVILQRMLAPHHLCKPKLPSHRPT